MAATIRPLARALHTVTSCAGGAFVSPARIERAAVMVAAYAFARQSVRDSAMGAAGMLALADAFAAMLGGLRGVRS